MPLNPKAQFTTHHRSRWARRLNNDDFNYTLPQLKSIEVGKATDKKKLMWLLNGCMNLS